jgi:sarcosine oxidase delta subunit
MMVKIKTNMARTILLGLSLLSFLSFNTSAQQLPLSETAWASVLTCGPGNDLYTSFGHSALRICDSTNGIDLAYNYGTFDFGTPHFYWKFAQGRLDYCLSRTPMKYFYLENGAEGRSMSEQRLNLSHQEVCNLFVMMEWNYQPENRYYRYDFFRDNCATRVRDMVSHAVGCDTVLHRTAETVTYRHLLASSMRDTMEWWRLGMDLLLGLAADHRCTSVERMFKPCEMEAELAEATMGDDNRPMVGNPVLLQPSGRVEMNRSFPPVVVFGLLLLVVAWLSWMESRKGWRLAWLDRVLFILAGLIGLFLLFMWFGSAYYCTKWNLNVLWASPLLILIAIRLKKSPRWALWLQEGMFAVALVWVVVCGLAPALVPIILIFALRVGMLFRR